MKKANPYLSNRASIFISIVAALRSVAEGDKIERGQIDGWRRKVHLPASQAEGGRARQALMEFVWPLLRPKCILRLGSEWVAAWEWRYSKTVRPLRLEVGPSCIQVTCQTDPRRGQGFWFMA